MIYWFIDFKDYKSICSPLYLLPTYPREQEGGKFPVKYKQITFVGSLGDSVLYTVVFLLEMHIDLNFQNLALLITEEQEVL